MEHWAAWGEPLVTPSIFIEGGGQGPRLDAEFRRGWRKFFSSAGIPKINVIRGGGGPNTWDQFQMAKRAGTYLLLVDSETVPAPGRTARQFLLETNKWKLSAADKDSAFLMKLGIYFTQVAPSKPL